MLIANNTSDVSLIDSVKNSFLGLRTDIIDLLPRITVAIVLLIIGLIVAKIIRSFLSKTFDTINLNGLFEKMGLSPIFNKIGLSSGPAVFLPKIIYALILLIVFRVAADSGKFTQISDIISSFMAYLPRVFSAAVVMIVGIFVADIISKAVFRALDAMGIDYAGTISKILSAFIFILTLTVALPQLGIETELLNDSVKILLLGISIALALALGLGLKTPAQNVVSGVYARDLYKTGTTIFHDGEEAQVVGVGPLTTKLQKSDGGFIILPNSTLVSTPIKGRSAE